ncbi:hypothetical protein [Rhizobium terrae]|uniref:hypothetical protein n=1 Tax=Rhizobium terrae TaxID=2171756 RepID=UPI0013C3437C|nr:hypothetical protein [Rhizobium terrae]
MVFVVLGGGIILFIVIGFFMMEASTGAGRRIESSSNKNVKGMADAVSMIPLIALMAIVFGGVIAFIYALAGGKPGISFYAISVIIIFAIIFVGMAMEKR